MVQLSQGAKYGEGQILGQLFADSQNDIKPDMEIINMPDGYELAFGSSVLTAEGDVAYLKSDKTWNWITSGGGGGGSTEMTSEDKMTFYYLTLKTIINNMILTSTVGEYTFIQQVQVDNNGKMSVDIDNYCDAIEQAYSLTSEDEYYIHFISDKAVDSIYFHATNEANSRLSGFSFIPSDNWSGLQVAIEDEDPEDVPTNVKAGDKKLNVFDGVWLNQLLSPDSTVDGFNLPITPVMIIQE